MIKCLPAVLVAFLVVATHPATAQDGSEDLLGTWAMTDVVGRSWNGTKISADTFKSFELEITEHDGPVFAGKLRWQFIDDQHQLDDGKQITATSEEDVLAIRDFDGIYVMVEHPDTSTHRLKIVDADTLEMVSYEGGPGAAAGWARFERK